MKLLIFIGLAGCVGTLCRYGMTRLPWPFGFPWGTLAVNLLGALIAGFCFAALRGKFHVYDVYFPLLFIGFLGAFTTFSTYTLESLRFLIDAQYLKFAANVVLQNVLGIAAVTGGFFIAKQLFG